MISGNHKSWKNIYRFDVLIALLVFALPFLAYIHLLFSDNNSGFAFFNREYMHVFASNRTFIWYFFRNLIPLILLSVWFLSTSKLYKFLLLPMIIMYIKSLFNYFYEGPTNLSGFIPSEGLGIIIWEIIGICSCVLIILLCDFYVFKNYRNQVLQISLKSIVNNNIQKTTEIYKRQVEKIRDNRNIYSNTSYLHRIMNIKLLLEVWMKKNMLLNENKFRKHKRRLPDSLVVFGLLLTISLWYSHYLVPDDLMYLEYGFIEIGSNGFDNVRTYIWYLSRKIVVILPMLIWYFHCTNWWRFAILSPVVIYSYQFWEATQDVQYLDAAGNIRTIPVIVLLVILLLFVSKIIKYRVDLLELHDTMVKEIDTIIDNGELIANKSFGFNLLRIKELRKEIAGESNQHRKLMRLISLRDELLKSSGKAIT